MNIGCALNLKILLHYYTTTVQYSKYEQEHQGSRPVSDGLNFLTKTEMLVWTNSTYVVTDKGKLYIERLLNIPFPEQSWINPPEGGQDD